MSVEVAAKIQARLKHRRAAETRFRWCGLAAIGAALLALVVLIGSIAHEGHRAFFTQSLTMSVFLDPAELDPLGTRKIDDMRNGNYDLVVARAAMETLGLEPDRSTRRAVQEIMSQEFGFTILKMIEKDPSLVGQRVTVTGPIDDKAGLYFKGYFSRKTPESDRALSDQQMDWLDAFKAKGAIHTTFNKALFVHSDSTSPEVAGLWGAIVGSLMTLVITALIAVPLAVAAAVYLEEYAPKNSFTDLIEVNINNLAAVPSIVFGLLGLAVFINAFGMPRSAPLVGGLVLALMVLPTIIISTRVALKSVPPSVRQGALALGASKTQATFHHVLPLAAPGIMTGIIISMAHALGETAPLLMIGMVSFVPSAPDSITAPATVLPVQIFIWENASERAFRELTAAAILVLLAFMIVMNATAVVLRRRFERRW